MNRVLAPNTFDKLIQFESLDPKKAYLVSELLSDLRKGIWSELATKAPIDIYRRNLQKMYVERLATLVQPPAAQGQSAAPAPQFQAPAMSKTNDAMSLLKGHIKSLQAEIRAALPAVQDNVTRLHLQDVNDRLTKALKNDNE